MPLGTAPAWRQLSITFADPEEAEHHLVNSLGTALCAAEDAHLLSAWFFIRKTPWRLRYRPADTASQSAATALLHRAADQLQEAGAAHWAATIYEPETHAFGGPEGMQTAHHLFHADSRAILTHLTAHANGSDNRGGSAKRREFALLLCAALMRAAGLDRYEQGDVWGQVAALRPHSGPDSARQRPGLVAAVQRLTTVDTAPATPLRVGALAHADDWLTAFENTGLRLCSLAEDGRLTRGIRAVVAHHVIFHWNRLGLVYPTQSALAHAAKDAAFTDPRYVPPFTTAHTATRAGGTFMTDTYDRADEHADEAEAHRLRRELVDTLHDTGWIQDPRVADAVASVPRHRFVPHAPLEEAYGHETVSVKDDADGASLSCASVPAIVAMMLQQADLAPGQRILEIGAGSGYSAALLAHLTAPGGQVTTIDVDPDLAAHARTHLHDAGYDAVEVICADGAAGHPDDAPFDRIIATVSPFDVPEAWLDQLAPDGRLVVPVRLAGDASRAIAFVRADDYWRGVAVDMCTFMPLRESTAADPRGALDITGDKGVVVQVNPDQHIPAAAVDGILAEQRTEVWTGVEFGRYQSFGDLWLWLALSLENSLSRMPVTSDAVESGIVEPLLGWGSMATTARNGESGLAYMTLHKEGERHELGVIGHGPEGPALADQMAREIIRWNEHYRHGEVAIDLYPRPQTPPQPGPGRFVLERRSAHLTVTWT